MKICLGAGHGGKDRGAIGPSGYTEADATLRLCHYIGRGLFDSHHEVIHIRTEDKFVSLDDRCDFANANGADLFLSIHCNAFSNPAAHGYEVYTSVGQTAADPIAERIFRSIGEAFPRLAPRFDKTDGDSDRESGFKVLVGTRMPAVLIETAFISNPLEEQWLKEVGWTMRMAGSIISGVNRRP
jgi:N-acetylmuramoyl-L-alanine amidase